MQAAGNDLEAQLVAQTEAFRRETAGPPQVSLRMRRKKGISSLNWSWKVIMTAGTGGSREPSAYTNHTACSSISKPHSMFQIKTSWG